MLSKQDSVAQKVLAFGRWHGRRESDQTGSIWGQEVFAICHVRLNRTSNDKQLCFGLLYRRAQPWRCDRHNSETKILRAETGVMLTSDSVADMTADSPHPSPGVSAESVSNCCGSETSGPELEISILAEQTPGPV